MSDTMDINLSTCSGHTWADKALMKRDSSTKPYSSALISHRRQRCRIAMAWSGASFLKPASALPYTDSFRGQGIFVRH